MSLNTNNKTTIQEQNQSKHTFDWDDVLRELQLFGLAFNGNTCKLQFKRCLYNFEKNCTGNAATTSKRQSSCSWSRPAAVCPVSWAWPPLVWPFLFVFWSRSNFAARISDYTSPGSHTVYPAASLILTKLSQMGRITGTNPSTHPPTPPSLVCVSSLSIMAGGCLLSGCRNPLYRLSAALWRASCDMSVWKRYGPHDTPLWLPLFATA